MTDRRAKPSPLGGVFGGAWAPPKSTYAEGADLAVDGGAGDAQLGGGPCSVALGLDQGADDGVPLDPLPAGEDPAGDGVAVGGQVLQPDRPAAPPGQRAAQGLLELG